MKKTLIIFLFLISASLHLYSQISILEVITTDVTCNGGNDGSVYVSISGGEAPYTYTIFRGGDFISNTAVLDTFYTFNSVTAKSWHITIEDKNGDGITDFNGAVVNQPAIASILSEIITPITCTGDNNGALQITGTGGSGNYSFELNPGSVTSAGGIYSPLGPGTYTITLSDVTCLTSVISNNLVLTDPSPLSFDSESAGDVSCNGDSDGFVHVSATGGTGAYTYTINPGALEINSDGNFDGFPAGTYSVDVTDVNSCPTATSNILEIKEPDALLGSITSQTNVDCFGNSTGSVTVAGADGTPGYQYSLDGGTYQASGTFSGLSAGNFTITIRDANACTTDVPVMITEPSVLTGGITSQTNVDCFGNATGSVTVAGADGTPGYQYSLDGGAYQASGTFSGLSAGNFTVTVRDANACTTDVGVTITEPTVLTGGITSQSNVDCFGNATGSVTVTGADGTPGYQYSLDGGAYQASGTFSGLSAGNFTITVRDANACTVDVPVTITEPNALTGSITGQTNVICSGNATGSVTVAGADGTPGYQYSLDGGTYQALGTFNGLSAGNFTVTVRDANACTTDVGVTITEPDALTGSITVQTNVDCFGNSTGSVTVAGADGTPGYQYSLDGGTYQASGSFSGLSASTFTVTVRDANACTTGVPITITEPDVLTGSITSQTNVDCFGNATGSVTVAGAGGTPGYQYSLDGVTYQASGSFSGLSASTFTVTVRDANACTTDVGVTITEPNALTGSIIGQTNVDCFGNPTGSVTVAGADGTPGYQYSLDGGAYQASGTFSGLSAGTFTVTVRDVNACTANVGVTITEPNALTGSITSQTNVLCSGNSTGSVTVAGADGTPGYQYSLDGGTYQASGTFSGLSAGNFTVTVRDVNGCTTDVAVTITEPNALLGSIIGQTNVDCFGNATGSVTVAGADGTPGYQYSLDGGTYQASGTFSGLSAGAFTVTVRDANACTVGVGVTITEPEALLLSLAKTDILCYGNSNGTITATATGGTLPYQYSKNGIFYQASNVFSSLSPNPSYTIWVKDAKGCTDNANISITEPDELKINSEISSSVDNLCFGDSFGEIRILDVSGGVLPHNYSIDDGVSYVTTSDFQFLPAGNYQVKVMDDNGCEVPGSLITISQPSQLKVTSLNHLDVTGCFGNTNGQIAIEGLGGTGTRYFEIDGGSRNTSGIFTSLSGGLHTLSIIDDKNCQIDTFRTILEPAEIILSVTPTDVTGCSGDNSGSILASAIGGAGGFLYEIDGVGLQASGTFNSLLAGTHTVSVEDANNCRIDSIVSLNEPLPISIDSESATDASCNGIADGVVSITVSGGTAPYTYTLNPNAVSNASGVFNSLPAGDYTISVDDANFCGPVTSNTLTVDEPLAIILDSLTTSPILCAGESTAEIHIYISGGTGPFQYSIDDGNNYSPTSDFTSLGPGTYHISATDANSCPLLIDTITFSDPPAMSIVTETVTGGAVCYGDLVGVIEYEVSGGTGSIEYSIDNGVSWQASGSYSGMAGGDYTLIARDQNNCTLPSSVLTINQPLEITADISSTDALNELSLGSISISNATGGSGGLEFSIMGAGGPFSSQTDYTDLVPGFYDVFIRDLNLCTIDSTVEIKQIPALNATLSIGPLTCNGSDDGSIEMLATDPQGAVEYSIDDSTTWSSNGLFENLSGGEYYIFARDAAGRYFADTITVFEPLAINIFSNVTPASCTNLSSDGEIDITVIGATGSVNYSWSTGSVSEDISNLDAGIYWVDVIDENLCSASDTIEVVGITNVTAIAGPDTSICFGESIILNGQGGTLMSWLPEAGLSNPNISNPVFASDTSISYYLTVYGLNDCYDIDTINITVYPNLGLNAGSDTTVINGQSVMIETTGGPYLSYLWEPGTGVDDTTSASPTISPQETAIYIVSGLTDDGCYDKDTIMISLIEDLIVYNAFSPNGDGRNDFWDIENAAFFPDIIVEVYNRWGEKFFNSVGYSDDKRWDGTNKGKLAPVGTYYYVVIPYNGATPITGPVTIVR